jgi:hypothetical protein
MLKAASASLSLSGLTMCRSAAPRLAEIAASVAAILHPRSGTRAVHAASGSGALR